MYRHIAIAIAKKILPPLAGHQEVKRLAAFLDNIFANQAGHSPSINRLIYAVEVSQPFQIEPERVELFRQASHLWHRLILAPIPASAAVKRPATHPGSAGGQTTPEKQPPTVRTPQDHQDSPSEDLLPAIMYTRQYGSLVYYGRLRLLLCRICQRAVTARDCIRHPHRHLALNQVTLPPGEIELLKALPVDPIGISFRRLQQSWK
jgi:hypothetical protein